MKVSSFLPTEEHLGITNGSVTCTDYNFHVEVTIGEKFKQEGN